MKTLTYTGLYLWEAVEELHRKGVTQYDVVFTGPPRVKNRQPHANSRVVLVESDPAAIKILVV